MNNRQFFCFNPWDNDWELFTSIEDAKHAANELIVEGCDDPMVADIVVGYITHDVRQIRTRHGTFMALHDFST